MPCVVFENSVVVKKLLITNEENEEESIMLTFFNKLIFCFLKYENNNILHKEFEYFIQFIFSDFCPLQLSKIFINLSDIFKSMAKSNSNVFEIKKNLANICEITTLIFLTKNPMVLKSLENSKFICFI